MLWGPWPTGQSHWSTSWHLPAASHWFPLAARRVPDGPLDTCACENLCEGRPVLGGRPGLLKVGRVYGTILSLIYEYNIQIQTGYCKDIKTKHDLGVYSIKQTHAWFTTLCTMPNINEVKYQTFIHVNTIHCFGLRYTRKTTTLNGLPRGLGLVQLGQEKLHRFQRLELRLNRWYLK